MCGYSVRCIRQLGEDMGSYTHLGRCGVGTQAREALTGMLVQLGAERHPTLQYRCLPAIIITKFAYEVIFKSNHTSINEG